MILVNMKNGEILAFANHEIVRGKYIALYGEESSYLVELDGIEQKLEEGGWFTNTFPVLYDTSHGALTDETIKEFGVSVKEDAFENGCTADNVRFLVNILRLSRSVYGL